MSELNLALMGPPGAGKGTQAERLVDDFDLPYYATGDILRAAVKEESPLGKEAKQYMENGDLVPDELICEVIMERVDSAEADGGFLLDGFPRTVGQAEALDRALNARGRSLTASLLIVAPDDEVVRRLSGRRICQKNGHVYHLEFDPPKNDDACDQDGSKLLQRDDDREMVGAVLADMHDEWQAGDRRLCPSHRWRCSTPTPIMDPSPPSKAASRHRGSPQSPPPTKTLPLRREVGDRLRDDPSHA